MRFDIVMYINAEGVDTSNIANVHRLPLIHALAREMRGIGKVLVVTHYVSFLMTPLFQPKRFLRYLADSSVRRVEDNLYVWTPFIPLNLVLADRMTFLLKLCQWRLRSSLRQTLQVIQSCSDTRRVAWFTHPFHYHYLGLAEEDVAVYECYDDFVSMSGRIISRRVIQLEEGLSRETDIVLATAETLYDRLRGKNSNTHYFPNAVDFELFNQATEPGTLIAPELRSIPHPIIGFMGNLCDWFDLVLLQEVIQMQREWSFIFVGEVAPNIRPLAKQLQALPNTFFLGWQDYYALPSFLKGFDVAIMPYKHNELVQSVNPNKMYQLMAAGVPIVSTSVREITKFRETVELADSPAELYTAIEHSISQNSSARVQKGIEIARKESWDARARNALSILTERLSSGHK